MPTVKHVSKKELTDEDIYVIAKKNYGIVIKTFLKYGMQYKEGKISQTELDKHKEEFLRRGSKYGSIIELYEKKHNIEPTVFHQVPTN